MARGRTTESEDDIYREGYEDGRVDGIEFQKINSVNSYILMCPHCHHNLDVRLQCDTCREEFILVVRQK